MHRHWIQTFSYSSFQGTPTQPSTRSSTQYSTRTSETLSTRFCANEAHRQDLTLISTWSINQWKKNIGGEELFEAWVCWILKTSLLHCFKLNYQILILCWCLHNARLKPINMGMLIHAVILILPFLGCSTQGKLKYEVCLVHFTYTHRRRRNARNRTMKRVVVAWWGIWSDFQPNSRLSSLITITERKRAFWKTGAGLRYYSRKAKGFEITATPSEVTSGGGRKSVLLGYSGCMMLLARDDKLYIVGQSRPWTVPHSQATGC